LGLVELLPALNTYHVANVSAPVQLDKDVTMLMDKFIVDTKTEIPDEKRFAPDYDTNDFCNLMGMPNFQKWAIHRERTSETESEKKRLRQLEKRLAKMLRQLEERLVTWIFEHSHTRDAPMQNMMDVYNYIALRKTLRSEDRDDPTKYEHGIRKRYKQDLVKKFGNLDQTTYLQDLFTGVNLLCDASPCPNLDRPPGNVAKPPCARRELTV
jgi:hemerythrin